jgi:peptide chain release factor subunit 1
MRPVSLTAAALRRVAAVQADGHKVLSVYLDLDPSRFPHLRDRRAELDSMLAQAARRQPDGGAMSHEDHVALRDELDRVRALLSEKEWLSPPSARGLAIFCSLPAGVLEVVGVPRPVEPTAVVATRPFVEPLAELAAPERWCAMLVSRRASRIFGGTRERLSEVANVTDDVHRRHAQGGWSQARYQRGIEHEVDGHIGASCELLFNRFKRQPFERLLIGGPSELHERVHKRLHADLRRRLAGYLEIDVERSSADDVHRRALPAIEDSEQRREAEALTDLREGLAPSGHSAAGLDEVLALLNVRRVRSLLVAQRLRVSGLTCAQCGWLGAGGVQSACPTDGLALASCEDVIEAAIEAALAQDAEVLSFHHHREELATYGSIAALLRY